MGEKDASKCTSDAGWREAALLACSPSTSPAECPVCHAHAVSAAWHVVDMESREALVDVTCSSCEARGTLQINLPSGVPPFFPAERYVMACKAMEKQVHEVAERIRQHAQCMPAGIFTTHPLWAEAHWSATTFRWHPASEAPPIMGLVFDNADAGKELFRQAAKQTNHRDEFEEIRVSIIEGAVPGQEHRPGYSVHICVDLESLAARATAADLVVDSSVVPFLGQWNRHYPVPGAPKMLPKFKMEFQKHREFLLAPAVRRQDGQLWFEPELGIVKTVILFRNLSEITPDDPDAAALVLPQIITPPE